MQVEEDYTKYIRGNISKDSQQINSSQAITSTLLNPKEICDFQHVIQCFPELLTDINNLVLTTGVKKKISLHIYS